MTLLSFSKNQSYSAICTGRSEADVRSFNLWCEGGTQTIRLNQQHTNRVICWQEKSTVDDLIEPSDGVLTDLPNVSLTLKTADCLPILLVHEVGDVVAIGAIHAGRAGTDQQILSKALQLLLKKWGDGFTSLWFGPHICDKCYQINSQENSYYNLRVENIRQVESILNHDKYIIDDSEHCTFEESEAWHSYRREGKEEGRNWSGIRLRTMTEMKEK